MKIDNYNVGMNASSQKTTAARLSVTKVNIVATADFLASKGIKAGQTTELSDEALLDLTEEAKKSMDGLREKNGNANKQLKSMAQNALSKSGQISSPFGRLGFLGHSDYRMELLERFMRLLTGKSVKIAGYSDAAPQRQAEPRRMSTSNGGEGGVMAQGGNVLAALEFTNISYERYESESVSFSSKGSVTTEDGRSIDFELAFNMSREVYEKMSMTSVTAGVFKDPLVINFDAAYAQLSDRKITFDLDSDGESDQISTLLGGSGYLAVDDGSGTVKDGSQLFGTQSGDGFGDLAKNDSDGNGWIDENDEIWDKLRIWTHDDDGSSRLIALGEVGIGAIYLGNVGTNYTLNGDSGETQGMLRSTGFFLRENGSAGTVQHVDLKI